MCATNAGNCAKLPYCRSTGVFGDWLEGTIGRDEVRDVPAFRERPKCDASVTALCKLGSSNNSGANLKYRRLQS